MEIHNWNLKGHNTFINLAFNKLKLEKLSYLFRELDGRMKEHLPEEQANHREHRTQWLVKSRIEGRLTGGNSLTLEGRLITGAGSIITKNIHRRDNPKVRYFFAYLTRTKFFKNNSTNLKLAVDLLGDY